MGNTADVKGYVQPLLAGLGSGHVGDPLKDLPEVTVIFMELQLSAFDLGHIQHVVDQ